MSNCGAENFVPRNLSRWIMDFVHLSHNAACVHITELRLKRGKENSVAVKPARDDLQPPNLKHLLKDESYYLGLRFIDGIVTEAR